MLLPEGSVLDCSHRNAAHSDERWQNKQEVAQRQPRRNRGRSDRSERDPLAEKIGPGEKMRNRRLHACRQVDKQVSKAGLTEAPVRGQRVIKLRSCMTTHETQSVRSHSLSMRAPLLLGYVTLKAGRRPGAHYPASVPARSARNAANAANSWRIAGHRIERPITRGAILSGSRLVA